MQRVVAPSVEQHTRADPIVVMCGDVPPESGGGAPHSRRSSTLVSPHFSIWVLSGARCVIPHEAIRHSGRALCM